MKDQPTNNLSGGLGITGSPDARRKVIVVPNSDGDERDSGDQHHTLFGNGTPTSITHSLSVGNPMGASSVLTGTMTVAAQERSSQECAEPSLMQRVKEAKSTQELCEVFGITTESVFTGGKDDDFVCACRRAYVGLLQHQGDLSYIIIIVHISFQTRNRINYLNRNLEEAVQ